jgi:hypothetical protein
VAVETACVWCVRKCFGLDRRVRHEAGCWCVRRSRAGIEQFMISAIFDAILMVLGLILDIITLPFRLVAALLGGAEFEFQRFSRRRSR